MHKHKHVSRCSTHCTLPVHVRLFLPFAVLLALFYPRQRHGTVDWVGGPKLCLTSSCPYPLPDSMYFSFVALSTQTTPSTTQMASPLYFLPFSPSFGGRFLFQASPEACHFSFSAPVGQQNPCKTPHPPLHPTNKHRHAANDHLNQTLAWLVERTGLAGMGRLDYGAGGVWVVVCALCRAGHRANCALSVTCAALLVFTTAVLCPGPEIHAMLTMDAEMAGISNPLAHLFAPNSCLVIPESGRMPCPTPQTLLSLSWCNLRESSVTLSSQAL